jgi:Ran-binding protein 9/10
VLICFFPEIRASILEGDIDKALKHTHAYYPHVLERNPPIVFRLKCRKFVELIRKYSDTQNPPAGRAGKSSNGHAHAGDTDVFEQDMELDEQINEGDQWEEMDTEDVENNIRDGQLLQEAMMYGQLLMQEYRDENREYKRTLDQVLSLIAYSDAKSSVHGHLLDPKGRVAVAEELNSAILGKSLSSSGRRQLTRI